MTIGLDANWLLYENAGIGKYSHYLIREILRFDKKNEYILLANFLRHYKKRTAALENLIAQSGNQRAKIMVSKVPSAWRERLSAANFPVQKMFKVELDVYFSPYFSGIFRRGFDKQIVTIHDLAFLKYPRFADKKLSAYYLNRTKIAVENSKKIIAVSQATKNDLVELLSVDPNKIKVILEGVDHAIFYPRPRAEVQKVVQKYKTARPYFLSVATLEPRKNIESIISTFVKLPPAIKNKYQLVLVGKDGWRNSGLKSEIRNQKSEIIQTGYVPDEDLPALYSGAEVFVYPSFYEGFGLPVLEAMACGAPTVVSQTSSLPEVGGNAAVYIDPHNIESISYTIVKLLNNQKLRSELNQKSQAQARKFSWQKAAQETAGLLQSVL